MSADRENNVLAKLATPLIILATVIWGSSFVVMKNSVDVLPTFWLLAIRFPAPRWYWAWCSSSGGRWWTGSTSSGAR